MSRGPPALFIVIDDTPETTTSDNGLDPMSDDDFSLFVEDESLLPPSQLSEEESSFLYGHFDASLFVEEPLPIPPIVIPPSPKKTRLIKCHRTARVEIQACLREFTENGDTVEVTCDMDDQIRFIVDLSSEECVLLNLASTVTSMTVLDIANVAGE